MYVVNFNVNRKHTKHLPSMVMYHYIVRLKLVGSFVTAVLPVNLVNSILHTFSSVNKIFLIFLRCIVLVLVACADRL